MTINDEPFRILEMRNKVIIFLFTSLFTLLCSHDLSAQNNEDNSPDGSERESVLGDIEGKLGIYYEGTYYEKDNYTEDGERQDLDDSVLIIPSFQIDYMTQVYYGFGFSAGLTGYARFDDNFNDTMDGHDHFVVHKLHLTYTISETTISIGRLGFENTTLLDDYYEAISITSEEIDSLSFSFALIKKYADSDPDEFIEFNDVNDDNAFVDDKIYSFELQWNIIPRAMRTALYYQHQGDLYDLYGTHLELSYNMDDIRPGLNADIYATKENREHGLRDTTNNVQDSNIYHLNPFIQVNDVTLSSGYVKADDDVGAREGGVIDDYFNPFNEGNNVYGPEAKTWYAFFSYESEYFSVELIYGNTEYRDDTDHLTDSEFNINSSFSAFGGLNLEAEFAAVKSEEPEGDFQVFEAALVYEF